MTFPRTFVLTVKTDAPLPKYEETAKHLQEQGIPFEPFYGMNNTVCRLAPLDTFDGDRVGEHIGEKGVCAALSHYMAWKVMTYLPEDSFLMLEYDAEFVTGWREQFEQAMKVLPDDWDLVFVGSCCCKGRPARHIGNNLYEVHYPLCGHAILYRKKALPVLLDLHQKIYAPLDIAMMELSLPKLRVYTIFPRIVDQRMTFIPP